ncbi:MAG: class I SAM-dependent methyltransferase [Alphaproteobacteria bacterium]|nr:class I SAM-dependent methyltransferase [Alphaproteobacteria bacterium]
MSATLVFPALGQAARDYHAAAQARGERLVAASSVRDSTMEAIFSTMHLLPYVHEDDFSEKFLKLIEREGIARVFAPVASVHAFLEQFIRQHQLETTLVGASPIRAQVEVYRDLLMRAEAASEWMRHLCDDAALLPARTVIAAAIRHYSLIYGESNDDKLAAMMAIFTSAPKGDVVEIGSLMGKSLSVLLFMAQRFATGAVLSVDPLAPSHSKHQDPQAALMSSMDAHWDYDILREALAMNLLPAASGDFNYLRLPSKQGYEHYCSSPMVSSEEFGAVNYCGRIAVLHIDGNHDMEQVSLDASLWPQRLAPGGWLILDDYLWAHGDGPMRVGDQLLSAHSDQIARSFVCGKALFVQWTG